MKPGDIVTVDCSKCENDHCIKRLGVLIPAGVYWAKTLKDAHIISKAISTCPSGIRYSVVINKAGFRFWCSGVNSGIVKLHPSVSEQMFEMEE